ncbi:hypothetical protein MBLNU457_g2642t1 [Dothideomycetes sp. NU457]
MAQPPIAIVGAGIGGLVLGRILAKQAIPYVIYERLPSRKQYNYGVTLLSEQLDTLSSITGIDRADFISRVAVDGAIGGRGRVESRWPYVATNFSLVHIRLAHDLHFGCFRANRGKVESLLASGLNIQYGSTIGSIDISSGKPAIHFAKESSNDCVSHHPVQHDIVVAADGVHSTIRQCLLPEDKPKVAEIVAIYGKRRIPKELLLGIGWPEQRPAYMDFKIEDQRHAVDNIKDVVTRISIADVKDDADAADMEWVYSRPSRGDADPLYKPNRSTGEASTIHESFFDEVRLLHDLKHKYPALWSRIFDVEEMKTDRKLSWLMRTVRPPNRRVLEDLAKKGVLFIGDSIHAEPIIGGRGYNNAIRDATNLADTISQTGLYTSGERGIDSPSSDLVGFPDKWRHAWKKGVLYSARRLDQMHDTLPAYIPPSLDAMAIPFKDKGATASSQKDHKL